MTDYTPWVAKEYGSPRGRWFIRSIGSKKTICTVGSKEHAELIASAPRLKAERDGLLEALTWVVDQVDRFGGITIENNHSAFEKFRALIAKVEK